LFEDPILSAIDRRVLREMVEGIAWSIEAVRNEMAAVIRRQPVRLTGIALRRSRP